MARQSKKRPSESRRAGELQIDEDPEFQRLDWKLQRAGWVLMAALVVAALVGLFGRGPLSATVEGAPSDPLRIEHNRFVRRHADEHMTLLIASNALDAGGTARIGLDSALLAGIHIQRITPDPEQEGASSDGIFITFRFDTTAPGVRRIRIEYQADAYWSFRGAVSLGDRAPLRIHSIVFP